MSMKSDYTKQLKSFNLDALKIIPNGEQNNFVLMNMLRCYSDAVTARHCDVLQLCRFCGKSYYEVPKYLELLPAPKLNRFLRRLRKINPDCGTPYQLASIKKLRNSYKSQTIVRTCRFCKSKRQKGILKPDKFSTEVNAEKALKKTINRKIETIKKLKKKRKFAGLNEDAVLSVKKQKLNLDDPIDAYTPKRKIMEESIIDLVTPETKNANNISIILLDTPAVGNIVNETKKTPIKNIQEKSKEALNIVNLITPITTSKKSGTKTMTPERTSKNTNVSVTPKSKNCKPSLVTPKSAKKKTSVVNSATPISSSKKNKKKLKLSEKQAKKNKILASDTNKKEIKQDPLANLLKDDSKVNKTISNLEQFLKSIS